MTPDITTLSDEELVDYLLKLRGEEIYKFCYSSYNCAIQIAAEVAKVRAELLARLSEKEEVSE